MLTQLYLAHRSRQTYPYLFAGALWLSWLISILLGNGLLDVTGQVIGTDYLMFYTAGKTLAVGESTNLYNFEFQSALQQDIIGPGLTDFFAYINLPFLAWLFLPLASLSYLASYIVYAVLGLGMLWLSLSLISGGGKGEGVIWQRWLLALTFVPVFSTISFGQNSFISLLILCGVYWFWKEKRPVLAGMLLAILLYKPQLVSGIGFLWVLSWQRDWKALVGFAFGAVLLIGAAWLSMPDAVLAYARFARETLPTLAEFMEFPVWHMHHIRGFWQLLLPDTMADIIWLASNFFALWAFWKVWQLHRDDQQILYAGAVWLTLWVTPHAMIYDWVLLLIPTLLLWDRFASTQTQRLLQELMIWGWIAYLVSGPLTAGQLSLLPIAIQVSVIFFIGASFVLWRHLRTSA